MTAAAPEPGSHTILIVDDTPANLGLAVDHLEDNGFRVVVAQDGAEGLERARFVLPDLILLDVMMPGIDGFETCRRLKADAATCDIPVIFMTALGGTDEKVAGFAAGGVDYLTKPFQIAEVLVRVNTHIALRGMQQRLEEQNRQLEREIDERREAQAELQRAYDHLAETTRRLQDTRVQLLQSEKMAAIGVLAAGVAHEINNPLGFLGSNLGSMENYAAQLLGLVACYEGAGAVLAQADPARFAAIGEMRKDIELDFLREDLQSLVRESRAGLARVKTIVQNLSDFSHPGERGWRMADLNACMDNTLLLAAGVLGDRIEVVREYGALPQVECLPLELNQALMNILMNAAQAIPDRGRIEVRSACDDAEAWMEIADDGVGIAPELLNRIFEPFFTTRPIGSGTGLGLSVAYATVHKHRGHIDVRSQPGAGTSVCVRLPLRQPDAPDALPADPCRTTAEQEFALLESALAKPG